MYKFATANSKFEKLSYFRHASSYNVHVYQFSAQIGLVDLSKQPAYVNVVVFKTLVARGEIRRSLLDEPRRKHARGVLVDQERKLDAPRQFICKKS